MLRLSSNERMSLAHNLRKPVSLAPVAGWTPERVARLRDLLTVEGATASQAAAELGVSHNAIIGKAYRDGIALASAGVGGKRRSKSDADRFAAYQARLAREREARAKAAAERRERSAARRMRGCAPADHIAPEPPSRPARAPMTLLDDRFRLGRNCRWSVGEVEGERGRHLFCAAPVPAFGDVYCAHHAEIARARPTQIAERRAAAKAFADLAPKQGRKIVASAERRLGRALA